MRVSVAYELCKGHGVCEQVCPQVFRMLGPKPVVRTTRPDESVRGAVEEAVRQCPTGAIRLIETAE